MSTKASATLSGVTREQAPPLYPVGEKVSLLINPYSPKEFKTDQVFFVFLAVGWFLILFAMMLLTFVVLPSFFRNFFEKLFGQLLRVVTVGSFFVLWLIFMPARIRRLP